jgi:5-oxoprolinase (ATP-hydrolysing)/N-methylhydantoinase A
VRGLVRALDGSILRDCGTGELVTITGVDQVVEVQLAGGSGFGDPDERDPAAVARDVADGVVG